ncbi:MAG: ABC transporter permease subunit [Chitinivibrionales bacterium]|nr:ABC transporter permease subunit [Chitinivibrionales bacterium]
MLNSRKQTALAYVFLVPSLALVAAFVLAPITGTFITSLYRDSSYLANKYVGIANFVAILGDEGFYQALGVTVMFTIVAVCFEAVIGLLFAILLHEQFAGRGALRALILIPWAIPTIISAKMWKLIFDYTYGILNVVLLDLGLIGDKVNWLGSSVAAFWCIIAAEVWKTTPFMVILLLAGLQAIPADLYQQARVDGAGVLKRFSSITLPLVKPVLLIALIFRTIDSLRIFDLIFVLTGGGPGGATKSLSMLGYEYFTADRFGLGSAVSLLMFGLACIFTLVYLRFGRFREQLA